MQKEQFLILLRELNPDVEAEAVTERLQAFLDSAEIEVKPDIDLVQSVFSAAIDHVPTTFYELPAGQFWAEVVFKYHQTDLCTVSEAAEILYGKTTHAAIVGVKSRMNNGKLPSIRRPDRLIVSRPEERRTGETKARAWYTLRSAVTQLKAELDAKDKPGRGRPSKR